MEVGGGGEGLAELVEVMGSPFVELLAVQEEGMSQGFGELFIELLADAVQLHTGAEEAQRWLVELQRGGKV